MQIFGYCHIHSKYSYDGELDLSEIKDKLSSLGAKFIFIAEHANGFNREKGEKLIQKCSELSDENILLIPGLEIEVGGNHILVLGIKDYFKEINFTETLKRYKENGCLIIWAHPHEGKFKLEDEIKILLDGIEVWNSFYDTKYTPRYSSLNYVKKNLGNHWLLFAGLDFHRSSHLPGPKIFLSVNHLRYEEIMAKIKTGEFQIGDQKKLKKEDLLGKKYYYYFCLSIFFLAILRLLRAINSILSALHFKVPAKIKNYLRRYI